MTFQDKLQAEFERLYGRAISEPEWEVMEHPERARVMAAQAAAVWNCDYRYTITALCKFTDLTRGEALTFYALWQSRREHEDTRKLLAKEPWK